MGNHKTFCEGAVPLTVPIGEKKACSNTLVTLEHQPQKMHMLMTNYITFTSRRKNGTGVEENSISSSQLLEAK